MIFITYPLLGKKEGEYVVLDPDIEAWLLERKIQYTSYMTTYYGTIASTERWWPCGEFILEFEDLSCEMLFKLTWL